MKKNNSEFLLTAASFAFAHLNRNLKTVCGKYFVLSISTKHFLFFKFKMNTEKSKSKCKQR